MKVVDDLIRVAAHQIRESRHEKTHDFSGQCPYCLVLAAESQLAEAFDFQLPCPRCGASDMVSISTETIVGGQRLTYTCRQCGGTIAIGFDPTDPHTR